MSDYPDYSGVKVNVYLVPDWAAREGIDKNLSADDNNVATGGTLTLSYAVAAGKELTVYALGSTIVATLAADRDKAQHFRTRIEKGAAVLANHGGDGGAYVNLTKPIVYAAGETLVVILTNYANHNCNLDVCVQAVERTV